MQGGQNEKYIYISFSIDWIKFFQNQEIDSTSMPACLLSGYASFVWG